MSVSEQSLPGTGEMPGTETPSQEVTRRERPVQVMPLLTAAEMDQTWRTAQQLTASRLFGDLKSAEQAYAKILIGRDLGLSPTRALMTVDLVRGNIQLRGVLLAAWVRESPDYDYEIVEMTHSKCVVRMLRRRGDEWVELHPLHEFTLEDAQRAQLVKEDSNWQKYPKNMCFWRALSNAVKFHAPDLFAGMPVYVEGEIPPPLRVTSHGEERSARGIELPADVEEVLRRAEDLGHAGLADRATAEMAIDGQPPEAVAQWVAEANGALSALADAQATEEEVDAEVVPESEPMPETDGES